MKILRILGFKDFLRYEDIVKEIKATDSTEQFSRRQHLLFIKSAQERLWMIGSNKYVYFIIDTGTKFEIVEKRAKKGINSFDYKEGEKYAKLIFKDNKKEIPFDKTITGGTETVITTFKQFLNE